MLSPPLTLQTHTNRAKKSYPSLKPLGPYTGRTPPTKFLKDKNLIPLSTEKFTDP